MVALMRQVGELLLHGAPGKTNPTRGPKFGEVVEVPGRERNGRPVLVVFTSADCEQCQKIAPTLKRMAAVYGPEGEDGHQLDVVAVLTDGDLNRRRQHAAELGDFARTDLVALMQDWDVPGTPFAVALDAAHRVKRSAILGGKTQLEMLPVESLGIIWRAPPEATIDAATFALHHVGNGSPPPEGVHP